MNGQQIRPSQFITTYGPGAILEGPNGPRVIKSLGTSDVFQNEKIENFEIVDQRLSQSLLDGAGIVRIPTNAELNEIDSVEIYKTDTFPGWSLCVRHKKLYRLKRPYTLGCPDCGNTQKLWEKSRKEAIRFVMACPAGHMDDVDWPSLIKHKRAGCFPDHLLWEGGGGALKYVNVKCPNCTGSVNLGHAYAMDRKCSGRHPEHGFNSRTDCEKSAKMMQRGAANLRIPELSTSLTLPRFTRLHGILGKSVIKNILLAVKDFVHSKEELFNFLAGPIKYKQIPEYLIGELSQYEDSVILQAIQDICTEMPKVSESTYRSQEFEALQSAASAGAPTLESATPGAPPWFEVIKNDVRTIQGIGGRSIRITPISRLRVVMVQVGYKRIDPLDPRTRTVPVGYVDGDRTWYPGVETFGEGIFIDLDPSGELEQVDHFSLNGSEAESWLSAYNNPEALDLEEKDEQYHPVFVWWHTLAHRLINALSIDSGYSSASIRERVFVHIDENDPMKARGGILLYTTQPGGDGTLGGLVALVHDFERVLKIAMGTVHTCSNDPLCGEEQFAIGRYNGAACYACQLVSETSCEHRNMKLDRSLLNKNLF